MGDNGNKEVSVANKRIAGYSVLSVCYTFVKRLSQVMLVYCLGYFGCSSAWLIGPVILSVMREEWKKEKDLRRNVAKAAAMCQEKDVILARVDDLPTWVFFPDVERAEWINRILRQVWPNFNHYARDLLKDTIEPAVRDSLAAYKMNGFKFDRMIIGSIPPRVGGVKVYDLNVSRNEIIMDLDIFYAGDCDISFSIGAIKGGIKDFQIHGMVRVVMKPLIREMPLVGGLQIFFLNNPTIDFNLVGVADLLDMPGLSDILRRIIVETVASMMVLPNKLPITLSENVPARILRTPEPEGVLRVHVVEAKDLMKKDIGMLGKGKSDPYAVITVGAQEFRTQTINNTVAPKWDYWCEAEISSRKGQEVLLEVWDYDPGFPGVQNDDYLGRATLDISSISRKGNVDMWVTLEDAKHGMVHLRMTWLKLSCNVADLKAAMMETQLLRLTSMSTGLLMVYLDSAKNLPSARTTSKPNPCAVLTLGKKQETTTVQLRTGDPVWEQGFTFLVNNPQADTLHVKVVDQKTGQDIGRLSYNLSDLMDKPLMQIEDQPLGLKHSGPDSKILLSMQMKILKHEEPKEEEDDDESEKSKEPSEKENGVPAPLVAKDNVSGSESPTTPQSHSPLKKQASHDSVTSASSLSASKLITSEVASNLDAEPPSIPSMPPPDDDDSELRFRTSAAAKSTGDVGLGRIQLTLRYSTQRQRFIIVIHKVVNLPMPDPNNIPDPYVKLYLLPERSKDSKRKTEAVKDNCNPVYDETFEYLISLGELNSRQLEISVVTKKGFFSSESPIIGQTVINLAELSLPQPTTLWRDLQKEVRRDA
ncbi:extended synaptotagmin-2 isoform X4 [Ischnura elegans]|uniref:extended synaptotagmin-2 isoform X4 n=1 Tax=Ischnura elegans TaxID=197161 RepID=UPI001ED8B8D3|nr:extended synaptotagmin-2 isoform X4 [Ischnura elegans]